MEQTRIKYFYIEGGELFAVADEVPLGDESITISGPPRIYHQEIIQEGFKRLTKWVEYNYR